MRRRPIRLLTAVDPRMSCGIGAFTIGGQDVPSFAAILANRNRTITSGMGLPDGVRGLRTAPGFLTILPEPDVFVEAVKTITVPSAARWAPFTSAGFSFKLRKRDYASRDEGRAVWL